MTPEALMYLRIAISRQSAINQLIRLIDDCFAGSVLEICENLLKEEKLHTEKYSDTIKE